MLSTATYHKKMLENFSNYPDALAIYQEFYSMGAILTEAKLDQDQVRQIFQAVADGYKTGEYKYNPDLYGTGVDKSTLFKKLTAGFDKVKNKIATSAPLRGFDVAFDKVQGDMLNAMGGDDGKVGRMLAKFREFGVKYPKTQSVIMYGLAAAAGTAGMGPLAAIVGLRVLERLLKGDKLTTAIWTGMKTFALGSAVGAATDMLGGTTTTTDTGAVTATEYTVGKGDTLSDIADQNNVSVKDMLAANPDITNPDQLRAGETIKIPEPTGSSTYDTGVGTASDTADKMASGTYKNRPSFNESVIDYEKTKRMAEIKESLMMPSAVYLTAYGVSKVFKECDKQINEGIWDSIKGAFKSGKNAAKDKISYELLDLYWRKNYKDQTAQGSVDSDEVIKFLTKMGVEKALVDNVMDKVVDDEEDDSSRNDDKPVISPPPPPPPVKPDDKKHGLELKYSTTYQQTPGEYGYWDTHSRDVKKQGGGDGGQKPTTLTKPTTPAGQTRPAGQSSKNDYTIVNNYVKNVAKEINQAASQAEKIKLAKELVNFMADRHGRPEWENAAGTVKQILNKSGLDPRTALAAVNKHAAGQQMESFQYVFINRLLEELKLTFADLGLVESISESTDGKIYIVEDSLDSIKRLI
jgi:LysM repeat protein